MENYMYVGKLFVPFALKIALNCWIFTNTLLKRFVELNKCTPTKKREDHGKENIHKNNEQKKALACIK